MINAAQRRTGRQALVVALMAASAVTAPAVARAADANNADASNTSGATNISELVVTAEKREERLIDVPISIAVNTGFDLKNKTISDLTELAEQLPNVNGYGTFTANFYIRGIESASAGSGFPPDVGVNVDEVFMGRDRAFDTVMADVASVDVLYGPQGSLYGKNTIAGVINITTNRPTNEYEALGDFQYGNYNYYQFRGTVSGPIVPDKLLARATFEYQNRDGYISDPTLNEKVGSLNQYGGRLMIVAKPVDNLTVELRADAYKENDSNGIPITISTLNGPTCAFFASLGLGCNVAFFSQVPPLPPPDDRISYENTPPFLERSMWGTSAKVEYESSGYTFTSITAFRSLDSDSDADQDGSNLDSFNTGQSENFRRFSQEIRVTSPSANRFSWILGGYYDDERDHEIEHIRVGDAFPTFLFGPPFPAQLPAGFQEAAASDALIDSHSLAGFATANFRITDKLKISGGIRYTDEHKSLNFVQMPTLPIEVGVIFAFAEIVPPTFETIDNKAVTGDATVSYDFTPDAVAYFRFAHGFKAGGFQSDIISPPYNVAASGLSFQPEYLNEYEIGFKSDLFNHSLSTTFSAFLYDFTNKQEEINTGVSFVVSNAATATSKGLEGTINWQVPMLPGLTLWANGGYLDAYYNYFPNGGGPMIAYTGNDLAGASKWSASWGATLIRPITMWPGKNFYFSTNSDYRSRWFTDPANTPLQEVEAYTIVNARIGIEDQAGKWGVYFWSKNLLNESVLGGGVDVVDSIYVTRSINIGRTFGIEVRAHL